MTSVLNGPEYGEVNFPPRVFDQLTNFASIVEGREHSQFLPAMVSSDNSNTLFHERSFVLWWQRILESHPEKILSYIPGEVKAANSSSGVGLFWPSSPIDRSHHIVESWHFYNRVGV